MGGALIKAAEYTGIQDDEIKEFRKHGLGGVGNALLFPTLDNSSNVEMVLSRATNVQDINCSVRSFNHGISDKYTAGVQKEVGIGMAEIHHVQEEIYHDEDGNELKVKTGSWKAEDISLEGNLILNYLPLEWEEDDLISLFAPYGDIIQTKIIRDRNSKRSLGYGFVKYRSKQAAQNAIDAKNGHMFGNKTIKVSFARPSSEDIKDSKLFIKHLPLDWKQSDVHSLFSKFGEIVECRLLIKKAKQTAFVQYASQQQAQKALALDGFQLPGSEEPLGVKFAEVFCMKKYEKKKPVNKNDNTTAEEPDTVECTAASLPSQKTNKLQQNGTNCRFPPIATNTASAATSVISSSTAGRISRHQQHTKEQSQQHHARTQYTNAMSPYHYQEPRGYQREDYINYGPSNMEPIQRAHTQYPLALPQYGAPMPVPVPAIQYAHHVHLPQITSTNLQVMIPMNPTAPSAAAYSYNMTGHASYLTEYYPVMKRELYTVRLTGLPPEMYSTHEMMELLTLRRVNFTSARLEDDPDRRMRVCFLEIEGMQEAQFVAEYLNGAVLTKTWHPIQAEIVSYKRLS